MTRRIRHAIDGCCRPRLIGLRCHGHTRHQVTVAVFDRHGVGKGVFAIGHLAHIRTDQSHRIHLRAGRVRDKAHRLIRIHTRRRTDLRTHGDIRDRQGAAG